MIDKFLEMIFGVEEQTNIDKDVLKGPREPISRRFGFPKHGCGRCAWCAETNFPLINSSFKALVSRLNYVSSTKYLNKVFYVNMVNLWPFLGESLHFIFFENIIQGKS